MHYVMFANWRREVDSEQQDMALRRRRDWQYPQALRSIVELWIAVDPPVMILAFEADDPACIKELMDAWGDVFAIRVSPALTPEEGLKRGLQDLNKWHLESPRYRAPWQGNG